MDFFADSSPWHRAGLSMRLDSPASCESCGAGKIIGFNYPAYVKNMKGAPSVYEVRQDLGVGGVAACIFCGAQWYLDYDGERLSRIPEEAVPLVQRWASESQALSEKNLAALRRIGATPPDVYGNGSGSVRTPCGIVTTAGERIDAAIVCQQNRPPFEHEPSRLASDIAEIYESPYALSLPVRIGTTRSHEVNNGFAPTVVRTPRGEMLLFNWTNNFYDGGACAPGDLKLVGEGNVPLDALINKGIYQFRRPVVYFVADIA